MLRKISLVLGIVAASTPREHSRQEYAEQSIAGLSNHPFFSILHLYRPEGRGHSYSTKQPSRS